MTVVCNLVTDPHGIITEASAEAAALLSIERRWLVQKPLATFVGEDDRKRFRTLLVELGAGRPCDDRHAFVLRSRRGTEIAAELVPTAVNGTVAWRVTADAELPPDEPTPAEHGDERLFERVLNRLPSGVAIVNRDLHLVFANPVARRLFATTHPMRSGDPLPEPWPEFSVRAFVETLFSHTPVKDEQLVHARDRVICVEGLRAGHAATATLLLKDVTERERTHRAERSFVENAAHELRTPLAAIVSVVDVLEAGAKDDPQSLDRFLAHIRTNSERLVRLATSLLVLARIQTGREQPRLDLVPIDPLLQDVARGLTPNPGVEVKTTAASELAALADRDLLYQALENVAMNAVKHTREGEIVLAARDLGRNVEIEVSDTGSGMERTAIDNAFDRFSRADGREQDGFGLGLAIADDAVRALDGSISLDSTIGAGTRVRIHLPSAKILT